MDGNAWDLVEKVSGQDQEKARSDSSIVSIRSKGPLGNDEDCREDFDSTNEAVECDQSRACNLQRSKSPALESLRKVSRIVLERIGRKPSRVVSAVNKKSSSADDDADSTVLISCEEFKQLPLEEWCARPRQYVYTKRASAGKGKRHKNQPSGSSPIAGTSKLVTLQRRSRSTEGKCAHLFSEADESADGVTAIQRVDASRPDRIYKYNAYCPVHGSLWLMKRRHLVDMHQLVANVETAGTDNEEFSPILDSQAYLAKMLRKRRRAFLSGAEKIHADKAKQKIRANLWIISVAFLFLFTGFNGLQNLQTTVNGQMGADALSVFYISLAASSLFVPSFALNRLGTKMTLITAIAVHILYMFANFIPRYYSLIPASILAGVAASCLWAAKCVYITESGIKYAKLNVEAQNVVIVRFFGYFFMIVHLGQVLGNLLSSLILSYAIPATRLIDRVDETCGHNFPSALNATESAELSKRARRNLARPPQVAYLLVVGVYLCCAIVALLIVVLFLNALKSDRVTLSQAPSFNTRVLRATCRNLKRPKLLLLIPLTIFNGIEQAFIVGLYTKAYVACGLGVAHIGYVMTSFGVADAICSLVFGPLIKLFGRMPLFVFGCVINMLMIMTLMIWPLNPGDRALFNAIAGVWGMADGVWNTQLNGFWVGLLGQESLELAFANYRFWMSSGLVLGFLMMRLIDVRGFLLMSFCCLLAGILGYLVLELYDMFIEFLFAFAADESAS